MDASNKHLSHGIDNIAGARSEAFRPPVRRIQAKKRHRYAAEGFAVKGVEEAGAARPGRSPLGEVRIYEVYSDTSAQVVLDAPVASVAITGQPESPLELLKPISCVWGGAQDWPRSLVSLQRPAPSPPKSCTGLEPLPMARVSEEQETGAIGVFEALSV